MTTSLDLTDALAKLDARIRHNDECPNGECLDRDDFPELDTVVVGWRDQDGD